MTTYSRPGSPAFRPWPFSASARSPAPPVARAARPVPLPATIAAAAAAPAATPVAVNCGPGQQALIRPGLVAGQHRAGRLRAGRRPTAAAYGTAYAVPLAAATTASRGSPAPVYREACVRLTASAHPRPACPPVQRALVKKSALIIGSSAGIGAGVGAAVKGKKGALIGAAIGGGAATVWDQATRRR